MLKTQRGAYLAILEGKDERNFVAGHLFVCDLRGHPALGSIGLPGTGADVVDVRHGGRVWVCKCWCSSSCSCSCLSSVVVLGRRGAGCRVQASLLTVGVSAGSRQCCGGRAERVLQAVVAASQSSMHAFNSTVGGWSSGQASEQAVGMVAVLERGRRSIDLDFLALTFRR